MAYSVADLITIFRREVDDPAYYLDRNLPQPNTLWSNYELIQILDQAQKTFAEEVLIFKDATSFRPKITEDDPWVYYDPRILRIERAEVSSTEIILPVITIEDFQTTGFIDDYGHRRVRSWESKTGTSQYIIRDMRDDYFRLYPIPEEDDTLKLTVRRLPMEDITNLTDEFEIPSRWQYGLLEYLRKEAFRKPSALNSGFGDAMAAATNAWNSFISHAESKTKIRTRGPGQTRYGGL